VTMHRITVPNGDLNGPFRSSRFPTGRAADRRGDVLFVAGVAYTDAPAVLRYFRATPGCQVTPATPPAAHLAAVTAMRSDSDSAQFHPPPAA
jgi:hypothetical protein